MAVNRFDQLNNPSMNFGSVVNRNALRGMSQPGPLPQPKHDVLTESFASLFDSGGGAALQLAGAEPGAAAPAATSPASKAMPTPGGYRARAARLGAEGTDVTLS